MKQLFTFSILLISIFSFAQSSDEINRKGIEFLMQKNYEQGIPLLQKSAEMGNAEAQYNLGYVLENGFGTEQNKEEAMKWYKLSAEKGFEEAIKALA